MWRVIIVGLACIVTFAVLSAGSASSQTPKGKSSKDIDKQHDELMKEFATRAHKLAMQYEQQGAHDKARQTLEQVLKVVPDDSEAKSQLDKINQKELTENKKSIKIMANQGWQKTGVQVFDGKPVSIEAKGEWVFKMSRSVSADGIDMPDDMKKFPLGSLIAAIDDGGDSPPAQSGKKAKDASRPFLIGSQKVFTPHATGMLLLKMHDSDHSDNAGQLNVTISGQVRDR